MKIDRLFAEAMIKVINSATVTQQLESLADLVIRYDLPLGEESIVEIFLTFLVAEDRLFHRELIGTFKVLQVLKKDQWKVYQQFIERSGDAEKMLQEVIWKSEEAAEKVRKEEAGGKKKEVEYLRPGLES